MPRTIEEVHQLGQRTQARAEAAERERDALKAKLEEVQATNEDYRRQLREVMTQRDTLADAVALEVDTAETYLVQGTPSAACGPLERIRAALAKAGRP